MTLLDFTLSNARRFYSSMGKPSDTEGLTTPKPSVSVSALMTLLDFTLSNARRFYLSMGKPSDTEGLTTPKPSVSVSALMTLLDFTLSNARRFYSSMGKPSDTEGLMLWWKAYKHAEMAAINLGVKTVVLVNTTCKTSVNEMSVVCRWYTVSVLYWPNIAWL